MKVDERVSRYKEHETAVNEFSVPELKHARFLLRRLRFLEEKIAERGGLADPSSSGAALFAEVETDALIWVLEEIGYLVVLEQAV